MNIVQVAKYIGYSYALLTLVACVYFYQANKDSSDLATLVSNPYSTISYSLWPRKCKAMGSIWSGVNRCANSDNNVSKCLPWKGI